MKNVIFNEKRDIENIISSGDVTQDSVNRVISSMAKYNLYIRKLNDEDNYYNIAEWLKTNYSLYIETEFDHIIRAKIKAAYKYNLLYSDDIQIYQNELDIISSENDIKTEKVLFVLLCIAKLQRNMFGYKNGKYKFALTNIFKLARVHIPSTNRGVFIHHLLEKNYIGAPFINSDDSRWVNFICEDGDPVIIVNELDFEELAYVYLNWKNNGVGYGRCEYCHKLMKKSNKRTHRFCENCSKIIGDIPDDVKVIKCIDCGKPVFVSIFDNETIRGEDCNSVYQRKRNAKKNKAYRERNKNKS